MSKRSNKTGDRPQHRGHGDAPTRDARGRWLPGHCPNRRGRPRRRSTERYSESDLRIFANTLVEVGVNGKRATMTRHEALLNKVFESAMKGRVSMQKFLWQEFEKASQRLAEARARYDHLLIHWIIDNPNSRNRDFEIPFEVEQEMASLGALLHHYFPEQYPPPTAQQRGPASDGGDA